MLAKRKSLPALILVPKMNEDHFSLNLRHNDYTKPFPLVSEPNTSSFFTLFSLLRYLTHYTLVLLLWFIVII